MATNKNFPLVIFIILAGIYLFSNTELFSISLLTPQVVYYNSPINIKFTTNLSEPQISLYFNEVLLSQTNQSITYTDAIINGSYVLTVSNITQDGLLKVIASKENVSEIQVIEVKKPFVDIKHDVLATTEKGTTDKIAIKTYNPQGEAIEADAVDIISIDPANKETPITATKANANEWELTFNYKDAGNYIFKIKPRKAGYDIREFTAITSVTKSAGIHPIIFVWAGAAILFLILFVIKRLRR